MSTTKVGWFGDSQLDYAQYGMTRRRDDFIFAVESALTNMMEKGIKTVIHAGDFLQSNRPSPFTMQALQKMQQFLTENNMYVYVISGNHDNAKPHWVDILNGGGSFGFQLLDRRRVVNFGVSIYGIPNVSREEFLKEEMKPADILVMHQAVTQFIDFPSSNNIDVVELPLDKYQVIAIGDIHIHRIEQIQQLLPERNVAFNCIVGYAGATELNSKSEPDEKVWIELEFEEIDGIAHLKSWTPRPIKTRPVLRYILKKVEELDKVIDDCKAQVDALKQKDPREPIIFIDYSSNIPGVIERFRQNFDPDRFILRLHAELPTDERIEVVGERHKELLIKDLLKAEVPETSALYSVADQLFNPDLDSEVVSLAVDTFIEERLKATTEHT